MQEIIEEEYEQLNAWGINLGKSKRIPQTMIMLEGTQVNFYNDTGDECNIIDTNTY